MAEFLLTSDPKSITPAQYRKLFRDYIEERLFKELESLVLRYAGPAEHTSIEVFCDDLIDFDPSLGFNVIHYPKLIIPIFDEAVFEAQTNLCSHPSFGAKHGRKGSVKVNCHVRIMSLPPTEYLNKPTISDIRADDVESLIQISGKVIRTGAVRMLETSKKYECQNPRCMYRFTIQADPEQDNMLPQPRTCPSPSTDTSGNNKKCHSTNLRELEGYRVCVDYQELKIQDSFERVSLGSIPRSIAVILEANLVDKFNAGDDVIVVGILVRQWKPVWKGARCAVDIALRANSILALNAQDRMRAVTSDTVSQFDSFWQPYRASGRLLDGRDKIIRSICPQLYGLYFVKLALLLTLVGGSVTQSDRGVKRRSQSHLLVVGDPGCGKSQILRFAASVVSRSVLTTGIGTSGAGLTCTAVRDGSDWSLEAGALVLANDGVCCIDEFASIKDQDRVTIHEAMEQQSISVAKAGLVVKLNTRATVLACCNPKGTYDVSADISTNTAIASPLLSRFDLVLVLLDTPQKEWDKRVSTFLLQQAVNAGSSSKQKTGKAASVEEGRWDILQLRDYIAYVKHNFQPTMSKEAQFLLVRYYQVQRQSEERSSGRTTVRLLESLMRLSEAHAKVMSRQSVLLEDAVVAIACVNLSQEQSSLLDATSTVHSDFPVDPSAFYAEQEAKVFSLLHCSKESLLRDIALQEQEEKQNNGSIGTQSLANGDGNGHIRGNNIEKDCDQEVFTVISATELADQLDLALDKPNTPTIVAQNRSNGQAISVSHSARDITDQQVVRGEIGLQSGKEYNGWGASPSPPTSSTRTHMRTCEMWNTDPGSDEVFPVSERKQHVSRSDMEQHDSKMRVPDRFTAVHTSSQLPQPKSSISQRKQQPSHSVVQSPPHIRSSRQHGRGHVNTNTVSVSRDGSSLPASQVALPQLPPGIHLASTRTVPTVPNAHSTNSFAGSKNKDKDTTPTSVRKRRLHPDDHRSDFDNAVPVPVSKIRFNDTVDYTNHSDHRGEQHDSQHSPRRRLQRGNLDGNGFNSAACDEIPSTDTHMDTENSCPWGDTSLLPSVSVSHSLSPAPSSPKMPPAVSSCDTAFDCDDEDW